MLAGKLDHIVVIRGCSFNEKNCHYLADCDISTHLVENLNRFVVIRLTKSVIIMLM